MNLSSYDVVCQDHFTGNYWKKLDKHFDVTK